MPGTTIRVQEKLTFVFAGSNAIAATKSTLIPVAINVDLSQYLWAALVLRVHSFQVVGAGTGTAPTVSASLYNSAPTAEDPGLVFRSSAPFLTGSAITYNGTQPAAVGPFLQVNITDAAAKTAGFADVLLSVTGYATTGTPDITVVVSIDIVGKS